MAVSLKDFRGRVGAIIDEITTLKFNISDSYDTFMSSKEEDAIIRNQKNDFKEKRKMYDRLFQEEEFRAQQTGGKSRQQTLQEYVLLFFFIAYAILLKAVYGYVYVYSGFIKAIQICLLLSLALIPIVVIMVKFM
jgi:Flp pilus assembly protein TadB